MGAGSAWGEPAPAAHDAAPPAPIYLRLATGAVGGTYFPVGQAMGRLLSRPADAGPCEGDETSCGVAGLTLVPMASEGTLANLQVVSGGLAEMALVQADLAGDAYHGTGVFAAGGALDNLRAIARLYPEAVHLIVGKASPIKSVNDLKGKRVAIGAPGSGINAEARMILKAYGLTPARMKLLDIGGRDAVDGLAQGEIDAMFFVGGVPVTLVETFNQTDNIRLVPISGLVADTVLKANKALSHVTIPDSAYPGLGPVETVGVATLWVTTTALDDELIEHICRTFWNAKTQARLANTHPSVAALEMMRAREGLTLPLHDGARACYDALGVPDDVKPEIEQPGAPPMPRMRPSIPASPAAWK